MIQKSHICNSFFENIISGMQTFYVCPDVPLDVIKNFFNIRFSRRKSQSQQNLAKKITFTVQFCSKNLTHFTNSNSLDIENNMLPQHNQKPFWLEKFSANMLNAPFRDAQELHSWSTLNANVCKFFYISWTKFLFQGRSKVLSGKGWDGGRLNNLLKVALCLVLVKYFLIFRFNGYFWKLYYF